MFVDLGRSFVASISTTSWTTQRFHFVPLLLALPALYAEQGLCNSTVSVRLSVPFVRYSGVFAAVGDIDQLLHGRRRSSMGHSTARSG